MQEIAAGRRVLAAIVSSCRQQSCEGVATEDELGVACRWTRQQADCETV